MVGADASHAWLAIYDPGRGWIDLDPTNDTIPSDQHVTVAWGRDYGDVSPVKGVDPRRGPAHGHGRGGRHSRSPDARQKLRAATCKKAPPSVRLRAFRRESTGFPGPTLRHVPCIASSSARSAPEEDTSWQTTNSSSSVAIVAIVIIALVAGFFFFTKIGVVSGAVRRRSTIDLNVPKAPAPAPQS